MSPWQDPVAWLRHEDLWILYLVLLCVSFLKYAVPFVPGDIVMLSSVFLIGLRGGSGWISAAAIAAGGTVGAIAAYEWGRRYGSRFLRKGRFAKFSDRVERLLGRWGYWPLLLNRFILYVRPVLLPAAGMLHMRRAAVAISALAGNILFGVFLVLLGHTAGREWGRFTSLYRYYQAWLGLLVFAFLSVLAAYLVYGAWRSRKNNGREEREIGSP